MGMPIIEKMPTPEEVVNERLEALEERMEICEGSLVGMTQLILRAADKVQPTMAVPKKHAQQRSRRSR